MYVKIVSEKQLGLASLEVGMTCESLSGLHTFGWVQSQHFTKQVNGQRVYSLSSFCLHSLSPLQNHLPQIFACLSIERQIGGHRLALWPIVFDVWGAQYLEYFAQLLDV